MGTTPRQNTFRSAYKNPTYTVLLISPYVPRSLALHSVYSRLANSNAYKAIYIHVSLIEFLLFRHCLRTRKQNTSLQKPLRWLQCLSNNSILLIFTPLLTKLSKIAQLGRTYWFQNPAQIWITSAHGPLPWQLPARVSKVCARVRFKSRLLLLAEEGHRMTNYSRSLSISVSLGFLELGSRAGNLQSPIVVSADYRLLPMPMETKSLLTSSTSGTGLAALYTYTLLRSLQHLLQLHKWTSTRSSLLETALGAG